MHQHQHHHDAAGDNRVRTGQELMAAGEPLNDAAWHRCDHVYLTGSAGHRYCVKCGALPAPAGHRPEPAAA